ncbi:hypothetical protein V7S43_010763 [Phytophthora oleae]|uniref:Crinkler (CRN) family protein n=1 Tax=Phytophthora oleae TaxID=2107226 RepID=A0ABD3FC11_9STRA
MDYHPGLYDKINTNVQSLLKSLAILSTTTEDIPGEMDAEQLFTLTSWTREDYKKALGYDDLFVHVRSKFTDSKGEVELEERYELLNSKLFIAGGNARLMFAMCSEKAMEKLQWDILVTGDITKCVDDAIIIFPDSSVNRLLAWYCKDPHPCFVSMFVAREYIFSLLEPRKLPDLALSLVRNSSMDNYGFELWFFGSLLNGGAHCHYYEGEQLKTVVWKAKSTLWSLFHPVERFDLHGVIPATRREQWLAPESWKQGSYDAVFIKSLELNTDEADIKAKEEGFTHKRLVRFVQLTSSTTPLFEVRFFNHLLTRLAYDSWIYAVEVCFVVPIGNMSKVQLPTSENDFKREAFSAFESGLPTTVSIQVVGLSYGLYQQGSLNVGR